VLLLPTFKSVLVLWLVPFLLLLPCKEFNILSLGAQGVFFGYGFVHVFKLYSFLSIFSCDYNQKENTAILLNQISG
jgi:hypothetical protein